MPIVLRVTEFELGDRRSCNNPMQRRSTASALLKRRVNYSTGHMKQHPAVRVEDVSDGSREGSYAMRAASCCLYSFILEPNDRVIAPLQNPVLL